MSTIRFTGILVLLMGFILLGCAVGVPKLLFIPETLSPGKTGESYLVHISSARTASPVFVLEVMEGDLPPGLSITLDEDRGQAILSGTPTTAGDFEFTLRAVCRGTQSAGQDAMKHYKLSVE